MSRSPRLIRWSWKTMSNEEFQRYALSRVELNRSESPARTTPIC
jgi:hypothetical protein